MFVPSPEKNILRRMGFLADQQGILNRFFRESDQWKHHLDNTSNFIIKCLKNKHIKSLIVLGSGWLMDFPLEKIAEDIEYIKMVDVYHPPQVQKKVKAYYGIQCISADITGGYIKMIYDDIKNSGHSKTSFTFTPRTMLTELKCSEDTFIISLNIKNQLDILLVDYLKKKSRVDQETILQIRERIQNDHVRLLMNNRYILITDYEELIINRKNQSDLKKNLIYTKLPRARYHKEWIWTFDTHNLYNPEGQTLLKVRALCSESPEIQ